MKINDIKVATLILMRKKYSITTYNEITDSAIEAQGLIQKDHANTIRACCIKNKYKVSFRAAGVDTISRIKDGNPCKGHNILDKSIKIKSGAWTYIAPSGFYLETYNGLVGESISKSDNTLDSIWKYNSSNISKPLADKRDSIASNLTIYYTGDYDMHDLLANNKRILANTPDEGSTIGALNNSIYSFEAIRKAKITDSSLRTYKSEYALIRHGAQTNFMSYLLCASGSSDLVIPEIARIPSQGQVTTIDDNIVFFDKLGKAYQLDSLAKVYSFYAKNNLLDQIPFYYFFDDLTKTPANKTVISGYSQAINSILENKLSQ